MKIKKFIATAIITGMATSAFGVCGCFADTENDYGLDGCTNAPYAYPSLDREQVNCCFGERQAQAAPHSNVNDYGLGTAPGYIYSGISAVPTAHTEEECLAVEAMDKYARSSNAATYAPSGVLAPSAPSEEVCQEVEAEAGALQDTFKDQAKNFPAASLLSEGEFLAVAIIALYGFSFITCPNTRDVTGFVLKNAWKFAVKPLALFAAKFAKKLGLAGVCALGIGTACTKPKPAASK